MNEIQKIIEDLSARKRSITCDGKAGLLLYLEQLGFKWKAGKTEGHKVFVHPKLSALTNGRFTTHGINCGHAPKRPMKLSYVVKVISLLRKYESELTQVLKDKECKK